MAQEVEGSATEGLIPTPVTVDSDKQTKKWRNLVRKIQAQVRKHSLNFSCGKLMESLQDFLSTSAVEFRMYAKNTLLCFLSRIMCSRSRLNRWHPCGRDHWTLNFKVDTLNRERNLRLDGRTRCWCLCIISPFFLLILCVKSSLPLTSHEFCSIRNKRSFIGTRGRTRHLRPSPRKAAVPYPPACLSWQQLLTVKAFHSQPLPHYMAAFLFYNFYESHALHTNDLQPKKKKIVNDNSYLGRNISPVLGKARRRLVNCFKRIKNN